MIKLILLQIIFVNLRFIYTKNIVLNINKISFENYIGKYLIDEYINYDIFTEIKIGTPPQKVTHFVDSNEKIFQFKKFDIKYNNNKFNNSVNDYIENYLYLFDSNKSISYKGSFSDNFIFENLNQNTVEVKNLNFTIYLNNRNEEKKYGIIGLLPAFENTVRF